MNVPSDLVPAGDYNIKVTSVDDNYTFRYSDYFSIQDTQSPSITVLTPNGSEFWATQSTYNIQWNSTQISGNIGIQLFRDSFEKTITLATANDGSFFWDIPNDLESADNYRVKIYSNNNSTINDFSDSRFSIFNSSSAYISIISPNGGEEWLKGSTEQIAWSKIRFQERLELISSRIILGLLYKQLVPQHLTLVILVGLYLKSCK